MTTTSHIDFEQLDPSEFGFEDRYKFLTAAVVPRPIALVTTLSPTGIVNAAPFSQFVIIAIDPPLLGIVIGRTATGEKDTLANIKASEEWVINTVPLELATTVQKCSHPFPPDVSEVEVTGMTPVDSRLIKPPRLAEYCRSFAPLLRAHDSTTCHSNLSHGLSF